MTVFTEGVAFFRTNLAATMEDACTIARTTSRGTFNTTTGRYATPAGSTVYTGACLIRPAGTGADVRARGDADIVIGRYDIRIPYTQDDLQPDDLLTVTASTFDTDLVGEVFTIIDITVDTYNTHRLLTVELNLGRGQP